MLEKFTCTMQKLSPDPDYMYRIQLLVADTVLHYKQYVVWRCRQREREREREAVPLLVGVAVLGCWPPSTPLYGGREPHYTTLEEGTDALGGAGAIGVERC